MMPLKHKTRKQGGLFLQRCRFHTITNTEPVHEAWSVITLQNV